MTGNQKLMAFIFSALPGLPLKGGPTVAVHLLIAPIVCFDRGGSV